MNIIIFRFFSLILLFHVVAVAYSQVNYREGRIITRDNDTLFGKIKDCGRLRNTRVCIFQKDGQDKAIKYYPEDIRSYMAYGDKYFMSKELLINDTHQNLFVEVLIEGKVNLYYYHKNRDLLYYIEKEEGEVIGLINEHLVIGKPRAEFTSTKAIMWNEYEVESMVFKDTLKAMFENVETIANQAYNLEYDQESLVSILKDYICATCSGDDCLIYETNKKKSEDKFGVFIGTQFSKVYYPESTIESSLELSVPIGLSYNIPLSLINERLSFQVELIYNRIKYLQQFRYLPENINSIKLESDIFRIPLKIKYEFLINRFTPTISFGKELGITFNSKVTYENKTPDNNDGFDLSEQNSYIYRYQKGGWFIDLGINYEISSSFSVFSGIRFQNHYNKIIENKNSNNLIYKVAEGDEYETQMISLFFGVTF